MARRYLVLGAAAGVLYVTLPDPARELLYLVVGLSCVAAILIGIRVNRPLVRAPWLLLAAGQVATITGDVLFATLGTAQRTPAAADLAYFLGYVLMAAGLAALIRARRSRRDVPGLIDSAIVTFGLSLLLWVFVVDPILDTGGMPVLERAVAAAYPASDILLLALAVRLMTVPGTRSPAFRLTISAILPLIVADAIWAAATPDSSGVLELELMWLGSYVLWGAAALHPTMAQLSTRTSHRTTPVTARRLAAMTCAMLTGPVLIVVQMTRGIHVDLWIVVVTASAMSLLVMWRMAYNVVEIRTTTRQRDRLQSNLFEQSSRDPLTGLANGPYTRELIGAALRRGRVEGVPVGLLLIGLDDFEQVNDRFGHGAGDTALVEVGRRLRALVRDCDTVGRLGGDQYVVLIDPIASDHDATTLAARLQPVIQRPIRVAGRPIRLTASIGAATSMDGGTEPDGLLHDAAVALRRAKAGGRGLVEAFDGTVRREIGERAALEAALTSALARREIRVGFRPVLALQTEVVDGYQAHVVCDCPGLVPQDPEHLRAVAATSDLICQIDRWVLGEAVAAMTELTAGDPERFEDLSVWVTIAGRTLADVGLIDDVRDVLRATGLDPHRLTICVTEMALVDVPHAALILTELRRVGVSVCIEDFGTGRTPLWQLQHLPADALKVDHELATSTEPGAQELLALLVNAAHGCGLLIVGDDAYGEPEPLTTLTTPRFDSGPSGPQLRVVPDGT